MICRQCLRRASALRVQYKPLRFISSTPTPSSAAAATSTGVAQPFSNPLEPSGTTQRPKARSTPLPVSSVPAGTPLKGLNYIKGRDDPVALEEHEYPEWLWTCLDQKKAVDDLDDSAGDEFSKSKKLRRKAAKRQRKLEEKLRLSGEVIEEKIPVTRQSIDLPANETGTVEGAMEAGRAREELRINMRKERRSSIKEKNFLKSM
ncbi:hypothetical protein M430DRAFT_47813 [Amorphotheca resinae ATCC 22711]|uniref:Large ribosomal subunit protein mL54 n=1 Tax=Amorphotheca resinae ATCC 22711 TaxID=857342 RepID=A0A2T3BAL0_AMORE|nr:hypothetical protein M430DRAFT_47813 [Amorphotheca resinae ATCC 22711]PSS25338.1 hypothetical protein M430DRAFT_47813 [Amorphotheca resinae ATCC 22711]